MKYIEHWNDYIEKSGRVFTDKDGTIYLNWTNSGVRFQFTGTSLLADLEAVCGMELSEEEREGRETWPHVAVFLDDEIEPYVRFEAGARNRRYVLFTSEYPETHMVTLRKLTENPRGKIGLKGLMGSGIMEPLPKKDKKLQIEFIGDSITCGFGNMSKERDRLFFSIDENGWNSHAAIAGRILGADVQIISYSGIALTGGLNGPVMSQLYPYTDCLIQEYKGQEPEEWDFDAHPMDVIVVNLGTNDSIAVELSGDTEKGIRQFEKAYEDFLRLLREKNGKKPWIICALGPIDYYLYNNIEKVAAAFKQTYEDERICCFKYGKVRMDEKIGPCGHPTFATHKRMGNEIAGMIQELVERT